MSGYTEAEWTAVADAIRRYDEQQAAEEALAADPISFNPHRVGLSRGRWKPVDDLPDIAEYQPNS